MLSAFVGALCVTPVTALVARQPSGPAALVSFTPAFSLLVPGALGLLGVADVLGGDSTAAASLVATLSTMVAIALGVLAGFGPVEPDAAPRAVRSPPFTRGPFGASFHTQGDRATP